MKFLLILILCLPIQIHAQDGTPEPEPNVMSQWTLVMQALAKKALDVAVIPLPVLVIEKNWPHTTFAEVVKNDRDAIKILKWVQKNKWNLDDANNFLSFGYDDMDDVYTREVGFCSGYTYVTWLLRYLVFFKADGPLMTSERMIQKLDRALNELKPVTITGVGSLRALSMIPEVERYLKVQVGLKWRDQSVTLPGVGIYLDQYRNKPVNWSALNAKVKFYRENGIHPILYAVVREPWEKFGKPDEVRMVHVMPVVNAKLFDATPFREVEVFQNNPKYLQELEFHQGAPMFTMLHTVNENFQKGFLQVGSDAMMVGYDEEKDSVLVKTYIDTIYYMDRIAAQVALNLKKYLKFSNSKARK